MQETTLEANYKNLERVIGWINNYDAKANIVLAFNGILLGFLISTGLDVKDAIQDLSSSPLLVFLLLITAIYVGLCALSAIMTFLALYPRIDVESPSPLYFGSIAHMTPQEFRSRMEQMDEATIFEELVSQTYINSKIALVKYRNLRISMFLLFTSMLFWAVSLISLLLLLTITGQS